MTAVTADERVEQLISLTEQLNERLEVELAAFEAHRPHEIAAHVKETQRLAELYRRETALVTADPRLIDAAPLKRRKRLADLTKVFQETVTRHAAAADAARRISEGIVRTIAGVIAESRKASTTYGPKASAASADARAIAVNRQA